MKHLVIDKKIDDCTECSHIVNRGNRDDPYWICMHSKTAGNIIDFMELQGDEQIPAWCELPDWEGG